MFHLLRMNAGINYLFGLISMLVAQSDSVCEGRGSNIAVSAFQQFFFGVAALFIFFETYSTFRFSRFQKRNICL